MIEIDGERFRLTIPMSEALSFAMAWTDLNYKEPDDALRHLVGLLAIDALQYAEEWRAAGLIRASLAERWPDLAW